MYGGDWGQQQGGRRMEALSSFQAWASTLPSSLLSLTRSSSKKTPQTPYSLWKIWKPEQGRGESIPHRSYVKKAATNHLSCFFLVFLEKVVKTIVFWREVMYLPALGRADHPSSSLVRHGYCPSSPVTATARSPQTPCRCRGAWTSHHSACLCADLSSSGFLSPSASHAPPVSDVQAMLPPEVSTRSDSTFVGIPLRGRSRVRGTSLGCQPFGPQSASPSGSRVGGPTCDNHISQVPLGSTKPPSTFPAPLQTPVPVEAGCGKGLTLQ